MTRLRGFLGAAALGGVLAAAHPPAVAAARAEPAQGDSLERLFLNELQSKLAADPFFRDFKIHVADDEAPLALLTQNPPSQKNRVFYLPWMRKLRDNLFSQYLRPLGLTRRSTLPVTPVIVLANEPPLRKYWESRTGDEANYQLSTFDGKLRSVVTCESGTAAWLRRQPVLRDVALGILEAHAASGAEGADLWYRRGLAGYVSHHTGSRKEALDQYRPDRYAIRFVFDLQRQKERREALWIPLEDLMKVKDLQQLSTQARGEEPSPRKVFDDECALWLHFFHHAQDGKYREGAHAYLGRALAGEGGAAAFKECFGTGDLAALEEEFQTYVFELFERIFIDPVRDETAGSAAEEEEAPLEPIDLSSLTQPPKDAAEGLGMALCRAASGRLTDAIATLEELQSALDGEGAEQVETELRRLRTLRDARDRYFAGAVEAKTKVRLTWAGRKVNDVPTGVADGELQFVKEESALAIPLEEIDSVSLALCIGSDLDGFGPGWLRSYAFALGLDGRWKRFLRDRGTEGKRLAADAEGRFPALVAGGRALGALNDLATGGTPETPEQAERTLERLAHVLDLGDPADADGLPASVELHRSELTELARRALRLRYLEDGVQAALNGETEALPDGRLRVTYDFSSKQQFEDFSDVPDYLEWRHEQLRATPTKRPFKVQKKSLRGSGAHCFRYRLKFSAPMSVAYEFEFDKKTSSELDLAEVLVAICDDGAGSYLGCYAQGELQIEQRRLKTFDSIGRDDEPSAYLVGHPHLMEIRHDGQRVSTWREGEKRQESPSLGLSSGYVFLWVALTGTLSFDNVVIEGTPDPVGLRELRDAWVDEQLVNMGLGESD